MSNVHRVERVQYEHVARVERIRGDFDLEEEERGSTECLTSLLKKYTDCSYILSRGMRANGASDSS